MTDSNEDFSLEERVLCSDGACIGLIGPDGRCKECGKAYEGLEPLPDSSTAKTTVPPESKEEPDGPQGADEPDEISAPDPSERVCCPDEMCVGIIGPDGLCGVCKRSL